MVPVSTPAATLPLSAKLRVYLSNMHSTNVALELGIPALYPGRKTDTVVNLNYYKIVVYPTPCWPTAVDNITKYNFDVIACTPNPAHSQAQISFESKSVANYQFTMVNALGETILTQSINADAGINYLNINTSNLANGMYLYSLSDNKNILNKKMEIRN
ncbi:MAG: T9SS type A sorting domain-containing protein [Bacteroidetes bacterium]|nr:T9SS type A sorting domain-containing protein [Bacteroidota bacterium]